MKNEKCYVTRGLGLKDKIIKRQMGEGLKSTKKCHVIFEGPLNNKEEINNNE